jgi:hypothetical protein
MNTMLRRWRAGEDRGIESRQHLQASFLEAR